IPQTIPETIQETRSEPNQSQEHIPTPPRPTTSDQIPPVFEQGHTLDPNIASFSGAYESDPDLFTSIHVEDETLGGSFHTTPPRSTPVPPVGPTSGDAKDLATLTALSSLVSELMQKVSTLETELKAHKLLFKDVVGKLVKKVKALELKLKTRSRKVVMSESDEEEEEEQDVDPFIKLAKTAAALDAHVDVSHGADIPPSPPLPTGMSTGVSSGVSTSTPAGTSNKGKSPIMKVDPPVKRRTFRQMEEDRLGEEAVKRLVEEEHADLERQRVEMFQEKRNKPMTYAQQKVYMRTFVKNQSPSIYTTGWTMKHVKSLSNEQLKSEFEKIRTAVADLLSQNIRRTLKRAGKDLEHDVHLRKSLRTRKKSSIALDLDADDRSFIRVLSDDDPVIFWSTFATWEVVPTPLGDINALYMMDRSSKYFTHLREILHLVDRQDLLKLYRMVVKYYEDHPLAEFMKVDAFGVHAVNFPMLLQRLSPAIIRFLIQEVWSWFQDGAVQSSRIVTTSRYVVPTGRVKVPAGRYVVPTGKDNVTVSAGRSKVIPAGLKIYLGLDLQKDLKEQYEQLVKDLRIARISDVSYKTSLESVEARLLVFKKNESVYEEDIKLLKREIYLRNLDIIELNRKLELAIKEKDEVQLTVQKFENSSKNISKLLDRLIMDKCKTGLWYNAVPPPYIGNFMPPKFDLVYPSLDDFVDMNESVSKSIVEKPTVETN
ncbi:hypothetical protein Tco_0983583, partial [Tanacetum coccineum]